MSSILDAPREDLKLEPFGDSQIKKDMISGKLQPGEQIWIYHDRVTNPWNLVARFNPYAHVVVYVGNNQVVHVSWAPSRKGLMKAKIRKQNISDVIKDHEQVIMGHKIRRCQYTANLREEIAARAMKCAGKHPSILFDYNHRKSYSFAFYYLYLLISGPTVNLLRTRSFLTSKRQPRLLTPEAVSEVTANIVQYFKRFAVTMCYI